MPEDPIAQGEIAALTRHIEENDARVAREFGIVKSDLTALRLQVGNLDQKVEQLTGKVDGIGGKLDSFIAVQQTANARILEMLATLTTKDPNQ